MFTGIIKEIGQVVSILKNAEGILLGIRSSKLISEMEIDDSVAVNGACQTIIKKDKDVFYVQSVQTTLEKTNFGSLKLGTKVNLELALKLSDRLDGHLVQGHVNGTAIVSKLNKIGNNYLIKFDLDPALMKYVIKEGSIAVNGVSLTVSDLDRENSQFEISLIPHSYLNTNFSNQSLGSKVNIEVDFFAKYLENFVLNYSDRKQPMTFEWIKSKGF